MVVVRLLFLLHHYSDSCRDDVETIYGFGKNLGRFWGGFGDTCVCAAIICFLAYDCMKVYYKIMLNHHFSIVYYNYSYYLCAVVG